MLHMIHRNIKIQGTERQLHNNTGAFETNHIENLLQPFLRHFHNSLNIFRLVKSGKMRLVGTVARMGIEEVDTRFW